MRSYVILGRWASRVLGAGRRGETIIRQYVHETILMKISCIFWDVSAFFWVIFKTYSAYNFNDQLSRLSRRAAPETLDTATFSRYVTCRPAVITWAMHKPQNKKLRAYLTVNVDPSLPCPLVWFPDAFFCSLSSVANQYHRIITSGSTRGWAICHPLSVSLTLTSFTTYCHSVSFCVILYNRAVNWRHTGHMRPAIWFRIPRENVFSFPKTCIDVLFLL
jgi:hypothetical protein